MKIISISGLDGSGKSTQIELLKSYLESQGKKVFYFHAIQFGLVNKISNFFSCHSERSEESRNIKTIDTDTGSFAIAQDDINNNKSITKANFFQIIARRIFLFIDLLRFKKLLKKLEKEGYDYLIADRYFYDSIVNIEYLKNCHSEPSRACLPAGRESNLNNIRSSRLRRLADPQDDIIKPDLAIYLEVFPENIMQRARKPDQGLEYLQAKKVLYDEMASIWNLKIIDGNRNKEEIFEAIKKLI